MRIGPIYLNDDHRKRLMDLEHAMRLGGFSTPEGLEDHLKLKMKDKMSDTHEVLTQSFPECTGITPDAYNDDKYLILGLFTRINDLENDISNLEGKVGDLEYSVTQLIDKSQEAGNIPRPNTGY